ncbi:DUF1294 domain-containing protein [Planococcus sp. CP5-4]|uniref:DUF1294 domain-containing protein n=1 Tax=unclassified Planococcus (in: firmicutes) TaxID=2662419 RepID=UPI001C24753D|nr:MULTISPECIES: DUF1294 domain-containing protein [unclassified Planococcus (in: firmicutes)]MBU9672961.1 DUF1294 domain-containing protein [Planococcus sp. CP5-4_YE]MBV0908733.1 DUF1294 domain-containing protein [Planococcus sp. CP5-4_UN]MBW6063502.1 DUF1294 domain-containing protein [Planococcus sp. CP5-4]
MIILAAYFAAMSSFAFVMMWADKRQAQSRGPRIPEKRLWLVAAIGGGIGAYLGMMMFRHKTKHTNFRIGFFALAVIQAGLLIWLAMA